MYDPRRYQSDTPNVLLPQPEWVNMGEDQPIDVQPAASAFADRFLRPKVGAPEHDLGRPMEQVAPHSIQGANPMGHEASVKPKSL